MAHFSMPNSTPMSWLYILTACIRVSSSFSFFANSYMSSMYIRGLTFSYDLLSLYPAVHFLSMLLSGIISIINSNGDSVSPWNTHWIFASAKLFPPAVNFTFQVFMVFSIIIIVLRVFYTPALLDGFSLESEWQKVSSSVQDKSQYSGRCQKCSSLNSIDSSSDFQLF